MAKGKGGGSAGVVVTFLVVATLIFSFFKIPEAYPADGIWGSLGAKAQTIRVWVDEQFGKYRDVEAPDIGVKLDSE